MSGIDIILQSGAFLWPLLAVLLIGAMQVGSVFWSLLQERKAAAFLRDNPETVDERRLVETAKAAKPSLAKYAVELILRGRGRRSEADLQHEHEELLTLWRERYARAADRIATMSDIAGGVGLMGTVWGMYETFFSGAADKATILGGMAVALSTTLVGIAISILLSLLSSEAQTMRSRLEETISRYALVLRQRFADAAVEVGRVGGSRPVGGAGYEPDAPALQHASNHKAEKKSLA